MKDVTNSPLISVLIANYNNGCYIEETLDSIYKQTYANWEIIIVDDGSTDNSFDIYKQLESNPNIKIYYNDVNKGIGYTKRKCVEVSSGDICLFLDPDDTIAPEALELMAETHLANRNASLVYSLFYYCDEKLNIVSAPTFHSQCKQNDPLFFNLQPNIGALASFKRTFYDKTEGIDPTLALAEDQDFYFKLYEVGDCIFLNKYLYYYRIHKEGVSSMGGNVMKSRYWHWKAIENTIKRRKLDIKREDVFAEMFSERKEYDLLKKKYDDVKMLKEVARIINQLKNVFRSKSVKWKIFF